MSNTELQYVYKYVNTYGDVAYVGITNNLPKRINQHKTDKLQEIKNPTIYYFPIKHRADAELLETYLISYYRTGNKYNVSKTKKGDVSFIDNCTEFPWVKYEGQVDVTLKPFLMSSIVKIKEVEKEVQIIKPVYIKHDSVGALINQIWQEQAEINKMIDENLQFEADVIGKLMALLEEHPGTSFISKGLNLHHIRMEILTQMKNAGVRTMDKEKADVLLSKLKTANEDIEKFEKELKGE